MCKASSRTLRPLTAPEWVGRKGSGPDEERRDWSGGGQDHHDLEARLLATLTTVGGQLSERIGVVEGALAVEDLEDGGGTPHYATL